MDEKVLEWRPFGRGDWTGYCDASPFPDGRDPMVAEVRVDGADGTAIWDGAGLHVDWDVDDRGSVRACVVNADGTDPETVCKALLLRRDMTSIRLRKLGFEDLGVC